VISSPWIALAIGAGIAAGSMTVLWLVQVWKHDATLVDVGWAYEIGILGVVYAIVADAPQCHRILVGVLAGIWSLRLGTYLVLDRLLGHEGEDGRYRDMRRRWTERGISVNFWFFVFFQAQALLVVWFAVSMLLDAYNPHPALQPLEIVGAVLWAVGLSMNVLSDVQLRRWRANPANKGKTCRAGLWRYSRHPNYFFEWVIWVGWGFIASAAPWGWFGWMTPALLLVLLFTITGIPPTEEQALRSRGEDYRRYQRETSIFVPWFPKKG
jgi:steroid 5-alpha reductase family enzyme